MNSILNSTARQLQSIPSRLRNAVQFQNREIALVKKLGFSLIGLTVGSVVGQAFAKAVLSVPKVENAFRCVLPLLKAISSSLRLGVILTGISVTYMHNEPITQSTAITLMTSLGFLHGFVSKVIGTVEKQSNSGALQAPTQSLTRSSQPTGDGLPA